MFTLHSQLPLAAKGFRLIVEDSKSSTVIGLNAVQKLINKHKVAAIIGGIESNSATSYFEEIRKYQVMFVSLAQVIVPRKIKILYL